MVGYNSCYAQGSVNTFIKINSLFFNTNDKTTFRINTSGDYLEIYNVDFSFQREVNDIGGIPSPSRPYPNTLSFTILLDKQCGKRVSFVILFYPNKLQKCPTL
jgi:hypothetical protein